MSIGDRLEDWELSETSLRELYHALGQNDTPELFDQPYKLNTEHDWPAAGGMSLDRKTVYIDRTLYQQVMDNEFKASGLEPNQLINGWIRHERLENAIIVGDNAVDLYVPAHRRALAGEHEYYRTMDVDPLNVESVLWPAFVACYKRPIKKPPLDAWCGVYLDDQGTQDREIIDQLIKLNVVDARRRSKYDTHYRLGGHRCDQCRNWIGKLTDILSPCLINSGMVRNDRACEFWMPADEPNIGIDEARDKLAQSVVDYTDKGHAPEFCDKCVHWQAPNACEIIKGEIAPKGWCRLWAK